MAVEVLLPKLGLTMDEGTIVSWLKQEGDEVTEGEPLLEIESDKAVLTVEAPGSGILRHILAKQGDVIPVGQVIAFLAEPGEEIAEVAIAAARGAAASETGPPPQPRAERPSAARGARAVRGDAQPASPAARRLAREHRIELASVEGTGPGGRIVEDDVRKALEAQKDGAAGGPAVETFPLSAIRRRAGQRLAQSFQTAPHFYLTVEVRADRLAEVRKALLTEVEKQDQVRLTYTDLLVKCVAITLRKHPLVNGAWEDGRIRLNPDINVALAMATNEGLVAPPIHKADTLSLGEIARRRCELNARAEKLAAEALQGGTFTLTNLGTHGIDCFHPILNPPQAAVLAVGKIADRPVAEDGKVVVRPVAILTLAVDHRTMDGADAAEFLSDLKDFIERLDEGRV